MTKSLQYRILRPTRFKFALSTFQGRRIKILEIGCGNHCPSLTKRWFPTCTYHGADIQEYNLSDEDLRAMDTFFRCDAKYNGYEAIEERAYDFVIVNHVLEHTDDPCRLAKIAAGKVRVGGLLWIAYPSFRSLSLPPGLPGTTNRFCDDPTHVTIVDGIAVCNALLSSGMKIVAAGRSRDLIRVVTGALVFPVNMYRLVTRGGVGPGMWHLMGFEDRVISVR